MLLDVLLLLFQVPLKWLRFEAVIARAVEKEVLVSNLQILGELAREVEVEQEQELVAVLEFYTSLGLLAYWGGGSSSQVLRVKTRDAAS